MMHYRFNLAISIKIYNIETTFFKIYDTIIYYEMYTNEEDIYGTHINC